MQRRKGDGLFVQRQKGKGSMAGSIGGGSKYYFCGVDRKRNVVGGILKEVCTKNAVEVKTVLDRVII